MGNDTPKSLQHLRPSFGTIQFVNSSEHTHCNHISNSEPCDTKHNNV